MMRMRRRIGISPARILCLNALLLWAGPLFGQMPNSYQITPDKTTMLVGETRRFRMVDQNGQAQHKVTWTISDASAFQSVEGDELQLYAKQSGEFRLSARTDFATAEGTVKVAEGSALPAGTVKWASGAKNGCKTTRIIPAVQVPNGPAMFQQSICEDGEYVAAYTADGVQLWRRKISNNGAPVEPGSGGNSYESPGKPMEAHATSVCDSVAVGTEQEKIRDLLGQRNLTFHEQPGRGRVWLVEESGTQCKLTFDEKLVLVKKQKVFVVE